ncbi:tripartite tricarboxylate transporter permease [Pigmentiphaga sp. YJ18]|uniref:tripartite tricarboxylate transporter permease n=1 Tax=Pigmentiphaga sp. YJ18 TaxID=3134907 RepID=UPI00311533DE
MELLDHLALGFATALSWQNLAYAFTGCLLGTLIGVLPGLGPVPTIAMLLPITYALPPTSALIMLASIYYGAQYGGSTTAILVKLPGESSSAVTLIDGHAMATQGRAGPALATAAIASFFAGCVGVLLLAAFAAPLAEMAFKFGPAEYFSLMLLGLVGAVALSSESLDVSLGMIAIGIILGLVGTDVNSGTVRLAFEIPQLMEGIEFTCLAMGLFGVAEIVANLEMQKTTGTTAVAPIASLMPTREDFRRMTPSIARGTALGSALGILPGAGVTISAFSAYTMEKKLSSRSAEMGHGAIEGVAAPEAANNAAAQTNFIPLLTLGVPGSAVMALMLGAMTIHNIQPGPQVMTSHPALFWGLIASMWIGNLILVVLNLPLIGLWVRLLKVPYRLLYPAILVFCCVGVYSIQNSVADVFLVAGFGVAGYLFGKLSISPVPLLLGFVLGPMMETSFRRTLMVARGDFSVFVTRPISLGLLIATALLIVLALAPAIRSKRAVVLAEAEA